VSKQVALHPTRHITGHFEYDSFLTINFTGTDN